MKRLLEIFFLPPMAIARLGSSPTPLESFRWREGATGLGPNSTVIEPAVTLEVLADGSVRPYVPSVIKFKDSDTIRPLAPFLELWARLQMPDGSEADVPLTGRLLAEFGASAECVRYEITAANRKAARRTGSAACAFIAQACTSGNNHDVHQLLAVSPYNSVTEPLVFAENPIPLGSFQVMRPIDRRVKPSGSDCEVDLDILRVRFTPPRGLMYGPPNAKLGPASPLGMARYQAPQAFYGRIHQIVDPQNRFLNPNTLWSTAYSMMTGQFEDPSPQDGYDGAAVGHDRSWGVVDDTSDAIIEASLALRGQRHRAQARVITSPPHFAPDRRPIVSIADDLADRELPPVEVNCESYSETKAEVLDLFQRALESVALLNLDAARARALEENRVKLEAHTTMPDDDKPKIGEESMTAADVPYIDKFPHLLVGQMPSFYSKGVANNTLPYTEAALLVHGPLTDEAVVMSFLQRRGKYAKQLLRPAFGRFSQLPQQPGARADPAFRDPRLLRDMLHDMRMPPYMRDSAPYPLSFTRRQYELLLSFIDLLQKVGGSRQNGQ
jgi:hypothetical protein